MGIVLSGQRLARELAVRGWNNADLAKAAHLSAATITAARTGKPVAPRTVVAIARALGNAPPIAHLDTLIE